jgi:hypothetical protein
VYCETCQIHVRRDYLSKHKKSFSHLNPYHGGYIDPLIEKEFPHYTEHLKKKFMEEKK